MKTELSKLREQLENNRDDRGRVPLSLRNDVIAAVTQANKGGMTLREISAELGTSFHTLMYWRNLSTKKSKLKPVRVAAQLVPVKSGLVIRGPRGLEIEGLDLSQLAELLVRLA